MPSFFKIAQLLFFFSLASPSQASSFWGKFFPGKKNAAPVSSQENDADKPWLQPGAPQVEEEHSNVGQKPPAQERENHTEEKDDVEDLVKDLFAADDDSDDDSDDASAPAPAPASASEDEDDDSEDASFQKDAQNSMGNQEESLSGEASATTLSSWKPTPVQLFIGSLLGVLAVGIVLAKGWRVKKKPLTTPPISLEEEDDDDDDEEEEEEGAS